MVTNIEKQDAGVPLPDTTSMTSMSHEANDPEANNRPPTPILIQDTKGRYLTSVLSRTLSRVRTKDMKLDIGPPPDGGKKAWTMIIVCHLVILNTWGFVNSFGLFETYYVNIMHIGNASQVAWIGSLQVFIIFWMGTFSGRALDAGFFKITFIIGTVIQLVGVFMTSLCKTYWQVLLAQGVCVGIGDGLVLVPTVALAATYFLKNRTLALAAAAGGSATGGVIFPAIAQQLLPKIGFPWTVRIMGFVMAAGMALGVTIIKPRLPPRRSGPLVEWTAFTELPYLFFCIAIFFLFWGVYIGFYYVGSFGRNIIHTSQTTSINLLLAMNGIGLPARIIPAYFADRYIGPLNMIMPLTAISGVALYCWIAVDTPAGVWVFALVYGIFSAGAQGLFPAVLTNLTVDPMKTGTRTGMGYGVAGFACLSGPPIAGALIERASGSYVYAQVFAGSSLILSFAAMSVCRWTLVGFKLKAKI